MWGTFAGKRQLAKHLTKCQAKPPKPKKQHFCVFCNREFNQSSNKQKHMKICKKIPKILFPNNTAAKVLPPKKAPENFMCEFCDNDFSYLCRKDLNEHRDICMVQPVNSEHQKSVPSGILFPPNVQKVSALNFVCDFCNNDFSYLSRKDLKLHRQMCETSFNMMVEPEMCTQSMVIKEEIDQ